MTLSLLRTRCPIETSARPCQNRALAAFSMMEVMVAALVLGLLMTSSIAAMQRAFPILEQARNISTSGRILQTEIERLRLQNWITVNALGNGIVTVDSSFTSNPAIGNRFTMTRTVSNPQTYMKEIKLTVSWTASDGRPLSRSYLTRYTDKGIYDYFYNTK